MQSQQNQEPLIQKIDDIKTKWQAFPPLYTIFDACMQTFYYTLINIMDIKHATHILQIACGTGKLLPLAMNMKPKECSYLATDLCDNMIEYTKMTLIQYLQKEQIPHSLQSYMAKNNLRLMTVNGQNKIDTPVLFDRIICNLVLMITEDPVKMLKNLHNHAAPGCLMGVTVWGQKSKSNLLTISSKALQQWGYPPSNDRSFFHLFNRIGQLSELTGWQVIIQWQQNAPFNHLQLNNDLMKLVRYWSGNNQALIDYHVKQIKLIFGEKQNWNFPVQMAVLRKK